MPLSKEALVFLSDEELLDLIIEECAELIYVASKAKRFGLEDINPTKPDAGSNVYEIALEHAQLSNLVTCLAARFGFSHDDMLDEVQRRARAQEARGVGYTAAETTAADA